MLRMRVHCGYKINKPLGISLPNQREYSTSRIMQGAVTIAAIMGFLLLLFFYLRLTTPRYTNIMPVLKRILLQVRQ